MATDENAGPRTVADTIVATLDDLRRRALAGEVTGLVYAAVRPDLVPIIGSAGMPPHLLVGPASMALDEVMALARGRTQPTLAFPPASG